MAKSQQDPIAFAEDVAKRVAKIGNESKQVLKEMSRDFTSIAKQWEDTMEFVDKSGAAFKDISSELNEGLIKNLKGVNRTSFPGLIANAKKFVEYMQEGADRVMPAMHEEAQKMVESGQVKGDADIKKLSDEISDLQKELQTLDDALTVYKQKAQNELIQKQQELLKPLIEKMSKTIEVVAKELKINFVLNKTDDVLLYGDKEFDITFKVLDKLK